MSKVSFGPRQATEEMGCPKSKLAAQIVILSQGWELYQGTADRMESDDGDSD